MGGSLVPWRATRNVSVCNSAAEILRTGAGIKGCTRHASIKTKAYDATVACVNVDSFHCCMNLLLNHYFSTLVLAPQSQRV
jgi:hypothetical protein